MSLRPRRPWQPLSLAVSGSPPTTHDDAWLLIDRDCRSAGAIHGARSHPHSVKPSVTLHTGRRVFEYRCSCARTEGCPAVYRVIVTLTPIAVEFAIDKAFEHHHLSRRSSRLPREVVSRISVLVGQCGVVKACQLRRFLGAEGFGCGMMPTGWRLSVVMCGVTVRSSYEAASPTHVLLFVNSSLNALCA